MRNLTWKTDKGTTSFKQTLTCIHFNLYSLSRVRDGSTYKYYYPSLFTTQVEKNKVKKLCTKYKSGNS